MEIEEINNPNSGLYEIKVEKGLPLIFIGGIKANKLNKKLNILIANNSTFYIDYVLKKFKYYDDFNICITNKGKDVNITSLVYYDTKLTTTRKSSFVSVLNSLMGKLEKVRNKIKQDNDIYINKEHELMCSYYSKYLELLYKIKMVKKK